MPNTSTPFTGRPIPRLEDPHLIQGQGTYVSDIHFDHQWVMALVRSSHAHALIKDIRCGTAAKIPGVHAIVTASEYPHLKRRLPGMEPMAPPILAYDRVHYVGQPIVAILADSRYIAEDAADLVEIDYEPLPAITNAEIAARDENLLHPEFGTNVLEHFEKQSGDGVQALRTAHHVVNATLRMGRVSAQPMEPRALAAQYDPSSGELLVYHATQSVHRAQERIANLWGMDPEKVRVVAPEVGGGFGVKNGSYPEEALVTYLAKTLAQPVKWSGDRFEEFFGTYQEREQVHHVTLGFSQEGMIVALHDTYYQDNGAFAGGGMLVSQNTARNIPGPYRIPNLYIEGYTVMTNKVPQAPYRGAGRPQGHYIIERMLDRAADQLGWDRLELKMKNLVAPKDFPYATGIEGVTLDSGNYPRVFQDLLEELDIDAFRMRQSEARQQGIRLGLGVSNSVEISAGFGFEGVRFQLNPSGQILLTTGATNQGQGHRTALAQLAADALSIPMEQVTVIEGDTGRIARSIGTFGSRTIIMAGNAVRVAAQGFIDKTRAIAADLLEAHVDDVVFDNGQFFVKGVPSVSHDWKALADAWQSQSHPEWPTHEDYFSSSSATYGFGSHGVIIAVNPSTAAVRIERYVILHDSGRVVNPLLANGQVIGGAVQGLGSALYEEMLFGPDGEPLTTSFLDYRLPGANEMPDIEVYHRDYPAPSNPEGYKGVGEAGIIPSQAIMLSAVEDAFRDVGLRLDYAPITPGRLFKSLQERGENA